MLGVYDYTVVLTYVSLMVSIGGMMFAVNGHLHLGVMCLAISGLCDMFDAKLARHYMGGWAVVIRLTVDDYHRYCYVADGEKTYQRRIPGIFHTVNPIANDICPIYKMNSREYCLVKNEKLGTVLMMEVGALMVGKIRNYKKERCQVKRGEEKGRFEFGGSTVVLLLEPDKVLPDSDLIRNTLQGAETIVKMGERIGGVVCLEKNSSI